MAIKACATAKFFKTDEAAENVEQHDSYKHWKTRGKKSEGDQVRKQTAQTERKRKVSDLTRNIRDHEKWKLEW